MKKYCNEDRFEWEKKLFWKKIKNFPTGHDTLTDTVGWIIIIVIITIIIIIVVKRKAGRNYNEL